MAMGIGLRNGKRRRKQLHVHGWRGSARRPVERATRRITLGRESLESRQMLATLVAGDANQDLHFDAADFVQAGKFGFYDRGPSEGVSWESGDWNTSESGEPGNPPVGDGEFNAVDLVAAFSAGAYNTGPYSDEAGEPIHELLPVTDAPSEANLIYDAVTGDLTFTTDGFQFSTFHVRSPLGLLSGPTPEDVIPPFDIHTPQDFFLFKTDGTPTPHTWPELVQPGLSLEILRDDLLVDGSRLNKEPGTDGDIGDVQLLCVNCESNEHSTGLSGQVFQDTNQNGVNDTGEQGIDGVRVEITIDRLSFAVLTVSRDLNKDGQIDPQTESGLIDLQGLRPGLATVALAAPNIDVYSPASGSYQFNLTEGVPTNDLDFAISSPFEAGDANRDYYYDPSDLVVVSKAGTYNSSSTASWEEGDWNDDDRFDNADLRLAERTGNYGTTAYGPTSGRVTATEPLTEAPASVRLFYDVASGDITVVSKDFQMSSFQLQSRSELLRSSVDGIQRRSNDVSTSQQYFVFRQNSALPDRLEIRDALQPGLTLEELLSDLRVDGSRYAAAGREHGDIGNVQLLCACGDGAVATLTGMVYSDENQNGQRDTGEVALNDVNVTLEHEFFTLHTSTRDIDLNGDGEIDPLTESGQYQFTTRLAGDVRLTLDDADWSATSPIDGYELTVVEGEDVTGLDLGAEFLPAPHLAGDANRDYYFNAADLTLAFKAGLYEVGRPATWEQGDWNDDGAFDSRDFVQAFSVLGFTSNEPYEPTILPQQHERQPLTSIDGAPTELAIVYDAMTGDVVIDARGREVTTLDLYSSAGYFVSESRPDIVLPPFDIFSDNEFFVLKTNGIGTTELRSVFRPSLTESQLLADLSIDGSYVGGGGLGPVELVCNCFEGVPATFDGQVFDDTNGNGQRDAGEVGVNGEPITIRFDTPRTIILETTTGDLDINDDGEIDPETESGWYRFDGIRPGSYTLIPTLNPGTLLAVNEGETFTYSLAEGATQQVNLGVEFVPVLLSGDANQDLHLTPADLLSAMKAGTYKAEPDVTASWAEGDWDTDLPGTLGQPAVGNGRFDSIDLQAVLATNAFGNGAYHAEADQPQHELQPLDARNDPIDVLLIYNDVTGDLTVRSATPVTAIHLRTQSLQLNEIPDFDTGFDLSDASDLFAFRPDAPVSRLRLAALFPPALTEEQLEADLLVDGAKHGGGDLGVVGLIVADQSTEPPGVLAGQLFLDQDRDESQSDAEEGTNETVLVIDSLRLAEPIVLRGTDQDLNEDGAIDAVTERGVFTVPDLVPGEYSVEVSPPLNWEVTTGQLRFTVQVSSGETTNIEIGVLGAPRGDVNRDFVTDSLDIDILCNATRQGPYDANMDLRLDQRLNYGDVLTLVEEILGTSLGDANLDGHFDSADLVQVWQAGLYEDGDNENASWSTGDWNCNQEFDAFDLVAAFQTGAYSVGPPANAVTAKPVAVQPRASTRTSTDRRFETPRTSLQDGRGLRSIAAALPVKNSPANRPDSQSFGRQRLPQYELSRRARFERGATTEVGAQQADEAFRESEFSDTQLFDELWGDPATGMSTKKTEAMRSEAPGAETFESIETWEALTLSDGLLQQHGLRRPLRFAKGGNV